jgi:ribosomal-protein-serine acetyltransferase
LEPILIDLPDELHGPRVLLRPYRRGEGQEVYEAVRESRETLAPWMPWVEEHRNPRASESFIRRARANWEARSDLVVGVWTRDSGRFLGSTGLHPRDWAVPSFEIGYWIRRSEEGHGYATECVNVLTRFAFEELHAERVEIRCDARNRRSAAVAVRAGYTHEGTLRSCARSHLDELYDEMKFAVTLSDFLARDGG